MVRVLFCWNCVVRVIFYGGYVGYIDFICWFKVCVMFRIVQFIIVLFLNKENCDGDYNGYKYIDIYCYIDIEFNIFF